MAGWRDLGNIWGIFKEFDIRPIRDEAERPVVLAFVGAAGVGKSTLIAALRHGSGAHEKVISLTIEADVDAAGRLGAADLVVLMLDATRGDYSAEEELFADWQRATRNMLVFYNKIDAVVDAGTIKATMMALGGARVALGSGNDPDSLTTEFVPRVLDALPDQHIALARRYPLVRSAVARTVINDTSLANAAIALGTALPEVVPVMNIPFAIADIGILTKNQAIMAYKLGLAFGSSPRWQDHVAELGGVVGAGFIWRMVARELVAFIPGGWGIVPKVAVAYAGTSVVGEVILRWYQTGEKLSRRAMRELFDEALARGKKIAQDLIARLPWPSQSPRRSKFVCPKCERKNPRDAKFCAYCATPLSWVSPRAKKSISK
jgi:uncharacterized protein (DUF697 family)